MAAARRKRKETRKRADQETAIDDSRRRHGRHSSASSPSIELPAFRDLNPPTFARSTAPLVEKDAAIPHHRGHFFSSSANERDVPNKGKCNAVGLRGERTSPTVFGAKEARSGGRPPSRRLRILGRSSSADGDGVDVRHRDGERFPPLQDLGVLAAQGDGCRKVHCVGHVHSVGVRVGHLLLPRWEERGGRLGVRVAVHRPRERGGRRVGAFELTLLDQSGKEQHKVHSHFGRVLGSGPYTVKHRGSMW
ncbi:hypothetical protein B296_00017758 [Ensete ventricosum]|uniref:Uncharacterized protein n=1 Tax=Ensete ventricosum TaxID=4639 RepID=A0A426ZYL5_ENSVE|nr:hypothetical protein B296_00017758 [Ensete ventricosum]